MTKSLFDSWQEVASVLRASNPLLACFDYDGTLTPIVSSPEKAIATLGVREALRELGSLDSVIAAVVSGRPMTQLLGFIPAKSLWLIGHHGLSVRSPDGVESSMIDEEAASRALEPLREIGRNIAQESEGLLLEDKGSGLAMHTRNASRADAKRAADAFCEAAEKIDGFALLLGKEVYELRPKGVDKGRAIISLRERLELTGGVLYVGDDTTDEDAFKSIKGIDGSVSVRVSDERRETAAEFVVDNADDVLELIRRLIVLFKQ